MEKKDLLLLLRDPDICREIYEIVQRGGIPLPTEESVEAETTPSLKQKNSAERERILAHRKKMQEKNSQTAAKSSVLPGSQIRKNFSLRTQNNPEQIQKFSFTDKLQFLRNHVQKIKAEQAIAETESSTHALEQTATEKFTFVLERVCPVCEIGTRVIYTKSRLVLQRQDLDLCNHYEDFNPYLYTVWACENCGFAAEDNKFLGHIPQRTKDKIRAFLKKNNLVMPFIEERTAEDALAFYEMAILFSEIFDPSPGRQAALYQKMAWILRYKEPNTSKEKEFLRKAAELYETSLETERYPIGKISDNMAMYLTCAIYFMLEDYDHAVKQLSHIINNQSLRTEEPKLFEKARDMWQEIKRRFRK